MLRREAELRLAPETQEAYHIAEAGGDDDRSWMEVTTELQRRVVREFGFGSSEADNQANKARGHGEEDGTTEVTEEMALGELRAAAPRYQSIAFWQKLVVGKAKRGSVRAGDAIPPVTLWTLPAQDEGKESAVGCAVTLADLCPSDGRPLAVVALSYS
mmetsp:Transcript_6488/g.11260  ORF Transcript_6488/g.11260 Transcript_6488/m.11260 type:complete len:158 (-) Transcript_6488:639-1112(-)